jgi:tetratricopeptide (TPR) repeat protein
MASREHEWTGTERSRRWWVPAQGAMIVLLAMIAYLPALQGQYQWDDENYISPSVTSRSSELIHRDDGLTDIWFSTKPTDYWPLTHTVFWLQWRLWGMAPMGYHAVNILLHALGAVLVWCVLSRLKLPGAWLGAALFAVHPVGVASVAWISELKNCLSLPLYAASVLAWLRFDDSDRRAWYGLSLAVFGLALCAKTSGIMLPLLLLGLAWWRRGSISGSDLRRSIPFFLLSLAMGLATIWFQRTHAIVDLVVRPEGLMTRLAGFGWIVWFYLCKGLAPLRLSMIYPRWEIDPASPLAWLPLLSLFIVLLVAWRYRKSWARPFVGVLGYTLLMLAPVSGLVAMSFQRLSLVSDHFQYLALPGVTALIAAGLATWGECQGWRRVSRSVGLILLVMATAMTWQRAKIFQTGESLWRDTLSKNAGAYMAHNNLGAVLKGGGQTEEAIRHYQQALRIKPDYAEAHSNWGAALAESGRPREAVERYQRALELKPDNPTTHVNLGNARRAIGQLQEALDHYQEALKIQPIYAEAYSSMGDTLQAMGRGLESVGYYQQSLRLRPNTATTHNSLGLALNAAGRHEEATWHCRQALKLRPDFAEAYNNLGVIAVSTKQYSDALEHFEEAVRLKPDYTTARDNLRAVREGLGGE